MLKKKCGKLFLLTAPFLLLCFLLAINVKAEYAGNAPDASSGSFQNTDTGYQIILEDDAGLLSKDERTQLSLEMQEITAYGNAAFKSVSSNYLSASRFAENYYHELFGQQSGILFLIDMDNREIYIFSDGAVYRTITGSYADTITDNVYRYASEGDYFLCASKAFEQINSLLAGRKIAQPMKYISNALLALILAMLANFGLIIFFTRLHKPKTQTILENINRKFTYSNLKAAFTHQTKIYDPVSSGGGHSGGGHGGGGHGGGGHSGGGGGHSF